MNPQNAFTVVEFRIEIMKTPLCLHATLNY